MDKKIEHPFYELVDAAGSALSLFDELYSEVERSGGIEKYMQSSPSTREGALERLRVIAKITENNVLDERRTFMSGMVGYAGFDALEHVLAKHRLLDKSLFTKKDHLLEHTFLHHFRKLKQSLHDLSHQSTETRIFKEFDNFRDALRLIVLSASVIGVKVDSKYLKCAERNRP